MFNEQTDTQTDRHTHTQTGIEKPLHGWPLLGPAKTEQDMTYRIDLIDRTYRTYRIDRTDTTYRIYGIIRTDRTYKTDRTDLIDRTDMTYCAYMTDLTYRTER